MEKFLALFGGIIIIGLGYLFANILLIKNVVLKTFIIVSLIIAGGTILFIALSREIKRHKKIEEMLNKETDLEKRSDMGLNAHFYDNYNPAYKTLIKIVIFGSIFATSSYFIIKSQNVLLNQILEIINRVLIVGVLIWLIKQNKKNKVWYLNQFTL